MMNKALTLLLALAGAVSSAQAQDAGKGAQGAADAARGEQKAAMCIGCHGIVGYQASFPEIYKVPMISGQNGKYLAAALNAYKKGERKHPTMRAIAASLSDADIADLSAHYEKHGASSVKPVADAPAAQPSADVAALLAKGACASCHGPNYNKPIDPSYPKLAGQNADYLAAALRAYNTTNNPNVGRSNAIMAGQVKQFKNAELKAIANYLGSLPGEMHTVPQSKFK